MSQQAVVRPTAEGSAGRARQPRAWREVAAGLLLGAGWGVVARAWMRYISTEPEFSWSGTLFIVGLAALAGGCLAVVDVLRRRSAGIWRVLLALPALLIFASPGMLMLPPALLGGFALSGRGPRGLRLVVAVLAAGAVLWPALALDPEEILASGFAGLPGYVLLCTALAAGWSVVLRRRVRP